MTVRWTDLGPAMPWLGCACGNGMPDLPYHSQHECGTEPADKASDD